MMSNSAATKRSLGYFALLFGALLLAYSPLVLRKFVFNDDNLMWVAPRGSPATEHPQFGYFFVIGRPLFSILAWPVWSWVDSVSDLSVVRFVMLFFLAACGVWLHLWFKRVGTSTVLAWLLPPILLLLPAIQTQMILANSFPHPVALLLAIAGAFGALDWVQTGERKYLDRALMALFLGLCIYPPTVFAYAALAYAHLWGRKNPAATAKLLVPLLLTTALYYVFSKLSYQYFGPVFPVADAIMGPHAVTTTISVADKLALFGRLLLQTANLWGISFQWSAALVTLLVIAGGYAFAAWWDRAASAAFVKWAGLSGILLVVSVLPQMAAQMNHYSFRSLTGMSWMMLLAAIWSVEQCCAPASREWGRKGLAGLLAVMLILCGYQCFHNIDRHIVRPAQQEASLMASRLKTLQAIPRTAMVVARPLTPNYLWTPEKPFNLLLLDDYGHLASVGPMNIQGLVKCMVQEHGIPLSLNNVQILAIGERAPAQHPFGPVLVVDMNEVVRDLLPPR